MKKIIYHIDISEDIKNIEILKLYKKEQICFLDIETTGLHRDYSYIMLIGFIVYDKPSNSFILVQLFLENKENEKLLLEELLKYINEDSVIITYNGYNFDIPFINHRLQKHNISHNIKKSSIFDIYKIIRKSKPNIDKNSKLLSFEKLNLKTIEKYLGIYRKDQISGKESVSLYKEYLINKNENIKNIILTHNYEDILNLSKIIKITEIIPINILINQLPIYYHDDYLGTIFIEHFNISYDYLIMELLLKKPLNNIFYKEDSFSLTVLKDKISLNIPIMNIKNLTFINIDKIKFINKKFNDLDPKRKKDLLILNKKYATKEILNLIKFIIEKNIHH